MLSSLHPLPKLVVCLVWIGASVLIFDPVFQLAVIVTAVLSLIVIDRRSPFLVAGLMVPFALFGFGFLTTSLLFGRESEYALRMAEDAPFGSTALSAGLVLFLRAIACGMVSALFALTTDPGALIKALMVYWRLSPRLAYSVFSALQLVPDLLAETQQIRLARAMKRGRPPRRLPGPVETASLVVPLLAYAIRRAGRAAIAMEARGLGARKERTVTGAPQLCWRDSIFVSGAAVAMFLCLAIAWPI
jgi:energy-coupling factor transport system permease protein